MKYGITSFKFLNTGLQNLNDFWQKGKETLGNHVKDIVRNIFEDLYMHTAQYMYDYMQYQGLSQIMPKF